MTKTKLNKARVLADVSEMRLSTRTASANLGSADDHAPTVASKGAGSVCVLRRRHGKGWRYVGYATWSCRTQTFVRGSWSHPVTAGEAHEALESMDWEG